MTSKLTSSPIKGFLPYTILILVLSVLSLIGFLVFRSFPHLLEEVDFQIFILGTVLFIGYYINRIAPKTIIPSFVWAILAGIAIQPFMSFLTDDLKFLEIVMEVFAAILLFEGGLEISFKTFKKYFFPITSLSLIGVLASTLFFSAALFFILQLFMEVTPAIIASIIIVSAALASTDPTALLPTFARMRFKKESVKEIAISESELSDITGSIVTQTLLLALLTLGAAKHENIFAYFVPLIQKSTYDSLALLIISGIIVGYIGFAIIKRFYYRPAPGEAKETDPALLLAVPIFTYAMGTVLGGAGFLAAFVSGLLTDEVGGMKKVSHFYESLLNHLIKPFIFITLGALVPLPTLLAYAPVGILAGFIFMFVIRPLSVFIALLPWIINSKFSLKDLLFISFIRETGIITAILIIIASAYDIVEADFAIAIGMWVILMTLIIEPPLTPYFAKKIGVATPKRD